MKDYNITLIKNLRELGLDIKVTPVMTSITIGYIIKIKTPFYLPNRKYKCEVLKGSESILYKYSYNALSDEELLEHKLLEILTTIFSKEYKQPKEVTKLIERLEKVAKEKGVSNPYFNIMYNFIHNTYTIYYKDEIGNVYSKGSIRDIRRNIEYNISQLQKLYVPLRDTREDPIFD